MGKHKKICEACGQAMMEYPHTLSRGLLESLLRLYRHGRPVNLKHLDLTHNQWANFQKLRYWGVVEKHKEDGAVKGGVWAMTRKGVEFVQGKISLPKKVWTYLAEPVRGDDEKVFAWQVHDGYKKMEDYAKEAVPHPEGLETKQKVLW